MFTLAWICDISVFERERLYIVPTKTEARVRTTEILPESSEVEWNRKLESTPWGRGSRAQCLLGGAGNVGCGMRTWDTEGKAANEIVNNQATTIMANEA